MTEVPATPASVVPLVLLSDQLNREEVLSGHFQEDHP